MKPLRERLIAMLELPEKRKLIYREVRRILRRKDNLCAATNSYAWRTLGVLDSLVPFTSDLSRALVKRGFVRFTDTGELQQGDVCFSVDLNGNGAPDHVYTFWAWASREKQIALVFDNYSYEFKRRNIGKGPRSPFAYALRIPESGADVTPWQPTRTASDGFYQPFQPKGGRT